MKQTAVEWLVEQLFWSEQMERIERVVQQAKEMEKEQIREAFINGEVARDRIDSMEYFKETYGHENK
jgi:hypothetical protein